MADNTVRAEHDQLVDLGDGRSVLYLAGELLRPDHVGRPSVSAELRDGAYQPVDQAQPPARKPARTTTANPSGSVVE